MVGEVNENENENENGGEVEWET